MSQTQTVEYVPIHTREANKFPLPDDYPSFLTNSHWWCKGRKLYGEDLYLRPSTLYVGGELVGYVVGLYCEKRLQRKTIPPINPPPLTWEECLQRCGDLVEWCTSVDWVNIYGVSTQIERMEWLAQGEKIVRGNG